MDPPSNTRFNWAAARCETVHVIGLPRTFSINNLFVLAVRYTDLKYFVRFFNTSTIYQLVSVAELRVN